MKMSKLIRKYRIEFALAVLAIFAILLLIGENRLGVVSGSVNQVFQGGRQWVALTLDTIRRDFASRSFLNLTALGLLVLVLLLIPWRIRVWIENAPRFNTHECPKCGRKVHRARRNISDRALGAILFLPLRRYKCVDRNCSWNGLVTAKSRQVELEPFAEDR